LKAFGSTKVQLSLVVVAFHAPILSGEKTPLQDTFHAQPLFGGKPVFEDSALELDYPAPAVCKCDYKLLTCID